MSSKRTVTLKMTSQKDVVTHLSDARTFGELKAELTAVNWNGMRVVERSKKVTLQVDDAILPAGDFQLFLVPEKVKSGAVEKLDDVKNANYNMLRSHGSFLNKMKEAKLDLSGTTKQLRKVIEKYYKKADKAAAQTKAVSTDATSVVDPVGEIEAARTMINDAIDNIIDGIKNAPAAVDNTQYLIKVSMDDLDTEIAGLKKQLSL